MSISTLRRRIRAGQIDYQLVDGRYLISDSAGETAEAPLSQAPAEELAVETAAASEPIISSASKLLGELKRAYTNILQEKEEQIIHLKAEVSDLKTLVRVLEDDNERQKRALTERQTGLMARFDREF